MRTSVFTMAFERAAILGLLTGAVSALTSRQQNQSWEQAIIAGLIIALTTVIARGGLEGGFDSQRAVEGNMNSGDVPMASDKVDVTPVAHP